MLVVVCDFGITSFLFLGCPAMRCRRQMFNDTVSADDNGGAGCFCQIICTLSGTPQRLMRKPQVTVVSFFDRLLVHGCSLQSISAGTVRNCCTRPRRLQAVHRVAQNYPYRRPSDGGRRPRRYLDHFVVPIALCARSLCHSLPAAVKVV